MVESASAFLMRAKSVRGKAGEGIPNVSPSVDARGASRSPSDGKRAKSRDSRTIQRIGRDAGNCVAQTERGAFRSSSLGDKSAPLPEHRFATRYRSGDMRSVFRLGRASRPLHARHICRARLWRGDGEEAGLGRLESIGVGSARRAERVVWSRPHPTLIDPNRP